MQIKFLMGRFVVRRSGGLCLRWELFERGRALSGRWRWEEEFYGRGTARPYQFLPWLCGAWGMDRNPGGWCGCWDVRVCRRGGRDLMGCHFAVGAALTDCVWWWRGL